ncbi:MAG: biotin/lipoate A/B protein ligase family protein, partial [Bacillota bacterium]
ERDSGRDRRAGTMQWRLLRTGYNTGAWNMAVDEAVMAHVARGASPPTFRLYGWSPPALSLGRLQSFEANVAAGACARLGVDVVRRPTGGRAVLHDLEVTYSLIVGEGDPALPAGLRESYRLATEGIMKGLKLLGVDCEISGREAAAMGDIRETGATEGAGHYRAGQSGACFDSPSWYEVTSKGRKLVGSAQARLMGVFLQHGSVLIQLDAAKLCALLKFESEEERASAISHLSAHATSISEILGRPVSFAEVEEAIVSGMRSHIAPIVLVEAELSPGELSLAEDLISRKYASPDWTIGRQANYGERSLWRCPRLS